MTMANIIIDKLPDKYHNVLLDWQRKHFKDYNFLLDNWSKFYSQLPFELVAKIGNLKSEFIEVGKNKGKRKFERASEMDEEMIEKTATIIKAQASTELGSIQQHRESLHKAQDPKEQFAILRVMAEEFRHAYQMIYVLSKDDWGTGGRDLAKEAIESLLGMETGTHVLDAFNLYFDSFVDNITFCAIIDRVGKYQLTMQTVFAYAPMARSMGPMLSEEAFHLASGVNPLRNWAKAYSNGSGNIPISNIQKHINKWVSRGLEMFGDERGGKSNMELGFKDMTNSEALGKYYTELKEEVVDTINNEVIKVKIPNISREDAIKLADEIVMTKESQKGISCEDLVYLPSHKFFRRRGVSQFQTNDVNGNPISSLEKYLEYLRKVLPESYIAGPDFVTYVENIKKHKAGQEVNEKGLPFYG